MTVEFIKYLQLVVLVFILRFTKLLVSATLPGSCQTLGLVFVH